jgi:hypothetical protein
MSEPAPDPELEPERKQKVSVPQHCKERHFSLFIFTFMFLKITGV